jgi:uncharacterized membrane protein
MKSLSQITHEIHESERQLLTRLRATRRAGRASAPNAPGAPSLTLGQRVADKVATTMGSWTFIILQSIILLIWIVLNIAAYVEHWDPYPFILLNLALSFQAAYAAPFIMMSQNRQQEIDRQAANDDYQINIKAELEIELLHNNGISTCGISVHLPKSVRTSKVRLSGANKPTVRPSGGAVQEYDEVCKLVTSPPGFHVVRL